MESFFLGFYFLFYFPFKNKNKISGDSNFFFQKINFSQINNKKRVSPIKWGRTWKMRVHSQVLSIMRVHVPWFIGPNPSWGWWWTQIKMGSTMKNLGFANALSHLIFCKERFLVILVTILKINFLSWDFRNMLFTY